MISWKALHEQPLLDGNTHLSEVEAQRVHGWLLLVFCADGLQVPDKALRAALAGCTHLLNSHRILTRAEIARIVAVVKGRVPATKGYGRGYSADRVFLDEPRPQGDS